ncbi:MAG TPA: hypothetical protein VH678_11245 [Xanthobacteraceae bacterium]
MRASILPALAATAMLVGAAPHTGFAGGDTIRTAQVDPHARGTPEPAPKVVIEAPRPPSVRIETEGRAGDRDCRHLAAPDRRDRAKAMDPAQVCDPE